MELSPTSHVPHSTTVTAVPKADLHVHAETAARLDRMFNGGRAHDWSGWIRRVMAEEKPGLDRLENMASISPDHPTDASPEIFEARVVDLLGESAVSGSIYTEVRFGGGTAFRPDFIELFRSAERNVSAFHETFIAEPLVTLMMNTETGVIDALVDRCIELSSDGLAGVDIVPHPYIEEADWVRIRGLCDRLSQATLGITVHAGEFSVANLAAACQTPEVSRLGHGIFALRDDRLIEQLAGGAIAVELCISSNVILGGVESYDNHPARRFIDAGISVTLNTDDPVRFQTDIGREYQIAHYLGFSALELRNATRTAIRHSFTTNENRKRLLAAVG